MSASLSASPRRIRTFGLAVDNGGEIFGPALGIWDLWYHADLFPSLKWVSIQPYSSSLRKLDYLPLFKELASQFSSQIKEHLKTRPLEEISDPLMFFSADHSGAIPIWSALLTSSPEDMGLIWVDAHMDSHTTETSQSKNIHGMPLAHLLGKRHPDLSGLFGGRAFKPEHVCVVAARSFEPEEEAHLKEWGVKVFYMQDIKTQPKDALKSAIDYVTSRVKRFGLTLDLDALDPEAAPGVSCPVPHGMPLSAVTEGLRHLSSLSGFAGFEITEYNPLRDKNGKTREAVADIVEAVFAPVFGSNVEVRMVSPDGRTSS